MAVTVAGTSGDIDPSEGSWEEYLGDVGLDHDLALGADAEACTCGHEDDPRLVYHSSLVSPRPILQVNVPTDNEEPLPDTITVELSWNGGAAQDPLVFDTTGFSPGDMLTLAVQVDDPVSSIGRYGFSLDITLDYETPVPLDPVEGSTFVVTLDDSPFGAGWAFSLTDQLRSIAADGDEPAGMLRVLGRGGWRFYEGTGGTYTSPAGDAGTLVQNQDNTYTYTSPSGIKRQFDSAWSLDRLFANLAERPHDYPFWDEEVLA